MSTLRTSRMTRTVRSALQGALVASVVVMTVAATPVRGQTGPILNQFAKLLASDGAVQDYFGISVEISGDTAVIGAMLDDDNGSISGSVYVFTRNTNGLWMQQTKLLPDDGAAGDEFGGSVAISGDTAIVGAYFDDDNGANSGSAYVFTRDANGVWTQDFKLLASDGAANDQFGASVAISGDTAVVGAVGDDDNGSNSGSAYVFTRDAPGVWTQQAKLLASDGAAGDGFGDSVAIKGDTAILEAAYDDDNGVDSGSAYIFTRDGAGVWSQQAKLLASDGAAGDDFGRSVALCGDTAVVGADGDDDACSNNPDCSSGSAYVFVRDAVDVWTQQAKLLASDGAAGDNFGLSIAISGDTAVVGAFSNGDSGSAYIFVRDTVGVWTQQAKLLADDAAISAGFAFSVSISADTIAVGAPADDGNVVGAGSAYIFNLGSPADLNGDGVVDGADLASLLTQWGTNGPADLNGDGIVNGADLAQLLTNWGPV